VRSALCLLLAGGVSACGSINRHLPGFLRPYRPDVQQGNVITQEMVDQLRPGISRDQVRFMLGTPLLADTFHRDRWDYLYYLDPRVGPKQRRSLVIFFVDNRLDHFRSDPMPPETQADNLILGRKIKRPAAVAKAQAPAVDVKPAEQAVELKAPEAAPKPPGPVGTSTDPAADAKPQAADPHPPPAQ